MEDWAAWCTRLTIDLISSSMFSSNFDTIHDHSTDHRGWTYIQQFPVVLREFAVLNAGKSHNSSYYPSRYYWSHPVTWHELLAGRLLRPLMFWKKEARAAADGAKAIHDVSQSLIEDYRRSMHPSGELSPWFLSLYSHANMSPLTAFWSDIILPYTVHLHSRITHFIELWWLNTPNLYFPPSYQMTRPF